MNIDLSRRVMPQIVSKTLGKRKFNEVNENGRVDCRLKEYYDAKF